MVREKQVTAWSFGYAVIFYISKRLLDPGFTDNIFEIATFSLIISSSLFILANINGLQILHGPFLGMITFNTVYLGILLGGTKGLGSSSHQVIEGLTRVILALCAIWKLSSNMRHLTLTIDPFTKERSRFQQLFYGVLYPPKEFFRLVRVLLYVMMSFYLVFSGLDMLSSSTVNLSFFQETERLSLNILFFGVQTPMMMASRASISKTFSEYLKNLEWADAIYAGQQSPDTEYNRILSSNEISYDAISSNGKHIWLTIMLMIILQAYQSEIVALDLFQINIGAVLGSILSDLREFFVALFT